jgi:hypothetical protein
MCILGFTVCEHVGENGNDVTMYLAWKTRLPSSLLKMAREQLRRLSTRNSCKNAADFHAENCKQRFWYPFKFELNRNSFL